jgi:hypothetical protein
VSDADRAAQQRLTVVVDVREPLREVPGVGRATARAIRDVTDGADAVSESAA